MTAQEYNEYVAFHGVVADGSPEHQFMHKASQEAIRITMEINNSYHSPEELRKLWVKPKSRCIDFGESVKFAV